jgi:hypothetical protein
VKHMSFWIFRYGFLFHVFPFHTDLPEAFSDLTWVFQIFELVNLTIFLRHSGILNFNNLKPYGISNFTASTASDAVPHRWL